MKNTKTKVMALAASAALVAMLGLAACGGGSSSSASASASGAVPSSASASSSSTTASSAAASSAAASSAAASSTTASSAAASSAATSAAASAASSEDTIDVSSMTAYAGATEAGEAVLYAESSDGTEGCLVFVDETGKYASFVGEVTNPSDTQVTITDVSSGLAMTFEVVEADNQGNLIIDMGSEIGKAALVPADINEVLQAIAVVGTYGTAVA